MKNLIVTLSLLMCFWNVSAQKPNPEESLRALIESDQFFRAKEEYQANKAHLKEKEQLMFGAWLDYLTNNSELSNEKIDQLFKRYQKSLDDSTVAQMLRLQSFNYFRSYHYKKAFESNEKLLKRYPNTLDSAELANYKNMGLIYEILSSSPSQKIVKAGTSKIPVSRDLARLLNLPVSGKDTTNHNFIFDTGANLSTITESYAQKFDLKVYDQLIDVGAFGGTTKARLGLCPQLKIGNATLTNVVFIVFPDSVLDFKSINYKINGIIGFPVMNALKEIHLSKEGYMLIPEKETLRDFQNLVLDGLQPMVEVQVNNNKFPIRFDTGANGTDFFPLFYTQYGNDLELLDGQKSIQGAGGMQKVPVKVVPKMQLIIAHKTFTMVNAVIHTQSILDQQEKSFGNLGQDVINQYPTMILNLKSMFVDFSDQ